MPKHKPAVVQSDGTILLEVDNPGYESARDSLMRFSDLVKSPEYIHTYRLSPLSLWNAAACGLAPKEVVRSLQKHSRYPVPENINTYVNDTMSKFGLLKLVRNNDDLMLKSQDPLLLEEIKRSEKIQPYIKETAGELLLIVHNEFRGRLKQALIKMGYPCEDLAGYVAGDPLPIQLRESTLDGNRFSLRPYQAAARDAFWAGGHVHGGSGVVVLPCGAGKTIVGMAVMEQISAKTLILTTNVVALRQWINEIFDKTSLTPDMVKEYSGEKKDVGPVTVSTYQILTYRSRSADSGDYPHFGLFNQENWGLIIYDEVHLLPAPVFRITADLQARRRLGLTATLVREDGREDEVFSLIGPKRFDKPWKELESQNWIAQAHCYEVRTDLDQDDRMSYALAPERDKYKVAATNHRKAELVQRLLEFHRNDQVLVIGQYLDQLSEVAEMLDTPLLCGHTPHTERERLYERFRQGDLSVLVVSKVANFAVDLPDANVAIQISGTFGSRQEEAQRLGRLLRPKPQGECAIFYTLVTRNTKDQEFAQKRQLFLTEQGYKYTICEPEALFERLRYRGGPAT